MERETFGSRLGFILISAGCAIGLGNIWRFPYITGQYGGAAFVLVYILFLIMLGLPILIMELSVGRASKKSVIASFNKLEKPGKKWHLYGYLGTIGNYILMMFYTVVSGWFCAYLVGMLKGDFVGLNKDQVGQYFGDIVSSPGTMTFWMLTVVVVGFFICSLGLRKGVERITKVMMIGLLCLIVALVIRALTLEGASEGIKFYLVPDFSKMVEAGIWTSISAALGQAFFTLGLGVGSMAVFGSYISKERRLTGEAISITILDTSIAILAGLIIFPACFAFGVNPGQGPSLVFVTLPNIFNAMAGAQFWGSLFFLFMVFAAMSTIVAVFENIVSIGMDSFKWSRKKAALINVFIVGALSMPTVLGFNLWSGFEPFGEGTVILDLLDFVLSNNILLIGGLVYVTFCVTKVGWGWDKFVEEVNQGKGIKFPLWIKPYLKYVLPVIIIFIFVQGYIDKFF